MHPSTGINPFFANYSFHPRFNLEILGDSVNPSAEERATRLGQVQQNLMSELKLTQEWQKKQADRRRKDHPNFKVGDKVWLVERTLLPLAHVPSWITSASDLLKSPNLLVKWLASWSFHPSSKSTMFSMSPCLSPIMKTRSQNVIENP
jgi:hypothetical protein